ncbi:MAG: type III-B CRISPR-associated protein Cas10/Cmr2 [Chloroflexi bacterium]|nr:type III-B CRISPR-associated protein Cas10/Cmr2 [Chloroflexota bacterium]
MNPTEVKQWWSNTRPLITAAASPSQPLPKGGLALLSADTDRTQNYVFQSARLPEIRGASMLLDRLNRTELSNLLHKRFGLPVAPFADPDEPGCIIYVGGGNLLALVPETIAPDIVKAIEALYPQETGTATITAVYQPITIEEARGETAVATFPANLPAAAQKRLAGQSQFTSVQRLMKRQALSLRRRKQSKAVVPHIESNPYARQCPSCGRRPVSRALTGIPDEPGRYLCHICWQNDRRGRDSRTHYWHDRFADWCKKTHNLTVQPTRHDDLSAIATASKRYIGFIYADGDRIGKWLEKTDSLAAYSQRSDALQKATKTAVYQALYANLVYDGDKMHPFEIITIGGDDVLLIAPANAALPIARDICANFHTALEDPTAPAMSAGVVIAHESNPIYFLTDLAGQLLASAKTGAHDKQAPCLDFMILKSQSALATRLGDVRSSSHLRVDDPHTKERCYLTGRPYTLPELSGLLAGVRHLQAVNFAPGQLHQMRREFQKGRFPGLFHYLHQRSRLNDSQQKKLATIERQWQMVDPAGAPPWRAAPTPAADGSAEFDTPFLDMLNLLDFV